MTNLTVVPLAPRVDHEEAQSHANAVKFLEDALQKAKNERAVFCLVIMQLPDGAVLDGWSDAKNIRPYITIGALEEVKQRFIQKNIEQR